MWTKRLVRCQRWKCLYQRSDRQPSQRRLKCVSVLEGTSFTESVPLVKQLKEMFTGPESSHTQLLPNNQLVLSVISHVQTRASFFMMCLYVPCALCVCLCVQASSLICRSLTLLRIPLPKELLVCMRLGSQSGSVAEPSGTPRGQSWGQIVCFILS